MKTIKTIKQIMNLYEEIKKEFYDNNCNGYCETKEKLIKKFTRVELQQLFINLELSSPKNISKNNMADLIVELKMLIPKSFDILDEYWAEVEAGIRQ